ncbi:hypothetical protein ACFGVR_15230 [Mucilaginibacter sp. AW1-3]
MKNFRKLALLLVARLCPCLIGLLTSCAALQKPAQEQAVAYRVTLAVSATGGEESIAETLAVIAVENLGEGYEPKDIFSRNNPQRILQFRVPSEQAATRIEQQLRFAGIVITGYHIEKLY